ncbi:hypothetical protein [uncultured Dubosiella sp.]|uniref:hypothetical protein n=1 Tax=uncultured Dubosiella sp. TaxID=1937011 RepID=UPI0025CD6FA9|nr:hypothetical protein [uncultured Dubosiella sp.]
MRENKPVQEYVKLRRLTKGIENLKSSEQRILDVALNYGFSNHANFTRVFKETRLLASFSGKLCRINVTIEVYFTFVGKIRVSLAKPELLTDTEKPAWSLPRRFFGISVGFLMGLWLKGAFLFMMRSSRFFRQSAFLALPFKEKSSHFFVCQYRLLPSKNASILF